MKLIQNKYADFSWFTHGYLDKESKDFFVICKILIYAPERHICTAETFIYQDNIFISPELAAYKLYQYHLCPNEPLYQECLKNFPYLEKKKQRKTRKK